MKKSDLSRIVSCWYFYCSIAKSFFFCFKCWHFCLKTFLFLNCFNILFEMLDRNCPYPLAIVHLTCLYPKPTQGFIEVRIIRKIIGLFNGFEAFLKSLQLLWRKQALQFSDKEIRALALVDALGSMLFFTKCLKQIVTSLT